MARGTVMGALVGLGLIILVFDAYSAGQGGVGGGFLVRLGAMSGGHEQAQVDTTGLYRVAPAGAIPAAAPAASATAIESASLAEATNSLVASQPVPAPGPAPPPPPTTLAPKKKEKFGFYMHVFRNPEAVIYQVRQVKKFFPGSPIYIMSDGGQDYTRLCEVEGCTFTLCPPANDRWHPWPFFKRIWDAANALDVEYVIMLEPDNTIHGPITRQPTADAGGLYVKDRGFNSRDYVDKLAQKYKPGFKWTDWAMKAGLAGGSYFRREVILDAFSDDAVMEIDWNYLGKTASQEIYSSDFAMQYALAARGYNIEPWEDSAQMGGESKDIPVSGHQDSAFRHYCGCYPGGKPTYKMKVAPEDRELYASAPKLYQRLSSNNCQICYNRSRYIELYGSSRCTVDREFVYTDFLMNIHHKDVLQPGGCSKFVWLCRPEAVYKPIPLSESYQR